MRNKVNEIKISYRENSGVLKSEPLIRSDIAAALLYESWDKDTIGLHETFKVVLLNNSNRAKYIFTVSTGGITGTMVDLRILFAVVLKSLSTAIILAHNHPSGTRKPSKADMDITKQIQKAAEIFGVRLDHLIILPNGNYYSFADDCIL